MKPDYSFKKFKGTMTINLKQINVIAKTEEKSSEAKLFRNLATQCLNGDFSFKKDSARNYRTLVSYPRRNPAFDEAMHQIDGTINYFMRHCDTWLPDQMDALHTINVLLAYYRAGLIAQGSMIEALMNREIKNS